MFAQKQSDGAMRRSQRSLIVAVGVYLGLTVLGVAWARDPFSPIGYHRAEPEKKTPDVALLAEDSVAQLKAQEKSKAELEKIQDREWLDAQKRLQVDGFVRSSSDSLNRERDFVMINRDLYSSGMHLTLTNQAIVFTWTVEIPNYRQVNFKRVSAVRVGPGGVPAQK